MSVLDQPRRRLVASCIAVALSAGLFCTTAAAVELRIGTQLKLMTLDPHYADLNENNSLLAHIYERLVNQDASLNPQPGLAVSWTRISENSWAFKLREGVRFHDGAAFTAQDVIYSINRIQSFLKPPSGGFQNYTQNIKSVTAPDPLTVVIETTDDAPTLPLSLTSIFIMHEQKDGFATTENLNSGSQPVGTGPYKFQS